MNSHFSTRYVLIATALTLTLAVGLTLTGTASAQSVEVSADNQTTPEPVAGSVGPIVIESYELRSGTMVLTLNVEEPTPYALTDALAGTQSSGLTELPYKQGAIGSGRQTLRLDVTVIEGSGAVTLSTPGEAVRIQSGNVGVGSGGSLIPASTVRMLVLGTAVGAAAFTFRTVRSRREEEEKEVERIL